MVDPDALRRVRTVEDLDRGGTRVSVPDQATRRETLAPLQAALVARVAGQLGAGPDTLLVPGPADLLYLEVMSAYLNDGGKRGLEERWLPIPGGGLHAVPALAALLGAPLRAAVLLGVGAGHPEVTELVRDGLLLPERLVPLTELAGGGEAGLEDLFDEGFYLELLGWSGVDSPRAAELPAGGGPLLGRIERALGHPVDRYRPARFLLLNQANLLPGLGRATIERFARLFERLNQLEPPGTS
jgi:hypothetical protein